MDKDQDQPFENQVCLKGKYRGKVLTEGHLQLFPNNCIGVVRVCDQQGHEGTATGVLVTSSTVLTSAHDFFAFNKGKLVTLKPFQFCLNVHGDIEESTKITVTDFRFPKQYLELCRKMQKCEPKSDELFKLVKESTKYDYALLKLQKNVNRERHPILCPDFKHRGKTVIVCGYSEDNTNDFRQKSHMNKLQFSTDGMSGVYDIDTMKGQSGSPVYFTQKDKIDQLSCYVVGLHKGYDPRLRKNVCTLLTRQIVDQVEIWMLELNLSLRITDASDMQQPICQFDEQIDSEVLRLKSTIKKDISYLSKILKKPKYIRLLYRASDHDFKAQAFHKYCGDYPDTLLLIRNQYDKTFGGYTHYKWHNDEKMDEYGCVSDEGRKSFLFQLDTQQLYLPALSERLIYNDVTHGPVFGDGTDLGIGEDCHRQYTAWSRIGWTYTKDGVPTTYSCDEFVHEFSGGQYNSTYFKVIQYQVFQVFWEEQK